MPELGNAVRLKKTSDDKVIGPMSIAELKQLAESALISPDDTYDQGDDNWQPVWELDALEMVWTIHASDGSTYGPTTIGTIKEFLVAGELSPEDKVTHTKTSQERTLVELLGEDVVVPAPAAENHIDGDIPANAESAGNPAKPASTTATPIPPSPPIEPDITVHDPEAAEHGQDVAKDLRIRQLEMDYESLQKDYDSLLHEYRKLTEMIAQKGNR